MRYCGQWPRYYHVYNHIYKWILSASSFHHLVISCNLPKTTLLLFRKQNLLKLFPQDGKQDPLHTIGQNLGLQSTKEQPPQPTLCNDIPNYLRVRDGFGTTLLVHLDDSNGVGACITDGTGAESHDGTTTQFSQLRVLLGKLFGEVVVGEEPGVMPNECSRSTG